MTDEGQQPTEGAHNAHEQDTPPFPVPWVQGAPTPSAPPVPPPPQGSYRAPDQQTPPFPMPWVQGAPPPPAPPVPPPPPQEPPYGSYALGALAGNPNLGAPAGGGYGAPPNPPYAAWTPSAEPPAQPSQGGRKHIGAMIGAAAAVVALAAGVGIGHIAWTGSSTPASSSASPGTNPSGGSGSSGFPGFSGSGSSGSGSSGSGSGSSGSSSSGSSGPSDVSSIADKVDPGLVDINTTLGYSQEQAAGTGIVLTSSGEILTNNHVIDGATTISVTDVGNGKTYSASVVGYNRTKDIAVLQLHSASGLQTASIGNSSNASVGEDIVGIGNAGGTGGTPSAAGGTVTALNQSITASDEGDGSSEQLTGLIETNANIQPGDSGGALVDTSGQVLGVDTAASAGFSFQSSGQSSGNQGYAIPINEATSIASEIEAGDTSSTVHIGATGFLGIEVDASSAQSGSGDFGGGFGGFGGNGTGGNSTGGSGTGGTSTSGAVIGEVITSSPAQEAGLASGDVITSLNGQTVSSPTALTTLILQYHPGDKVTVGWTDSSGQSHTATVQLTSGPPQ